LRRREERKSEIPSSNLLFPIAHVLHAVYT